VQEDRSGSDWLPEGDWCVPGKDNVNARLEQAAYLLALQGLKGIGAQRALQIVREFPDRASLERANASDIGLRLETRLSKLLLQAMKAEWNAALDRARRVLNEELDCNIVPLPITDDEYPPLLKLIKNPPPILHMRGSVEALSQSSMVAVVGTRNASKLGKEIAHRIASKLASMGFVVVSGLAKGIDAAAHRGVLDARGRTVAVLGTDLVKIYPKENRGLADEIVEMGGCLVTEVKLRETTTKKTFVERDRIQSGLSLGVIAVQSKKSGGTMHTVRFAEAQGRLVYCPRPLVSDLYDNRYEGILALVAAGRARAFDAEDYPSLASEMRAHWDRLLSQKTGDDPGSRSRTEGDASQIRMNL
jgi:DNA processing protein